MHYREAKDGMANDDADGGDATLATNQPTHTDTCPANVTSRRVLRQRNYSLNELHVQLHFNAMQCTV